MKKITLIFAVLFLIRCGSVKNTSSVINNSKETKHVLVFINNISDMPISDKVKKEIIDINSFKNSKQNFIFHTERKENIVYDYGLELLIKEINIDIQNDTPKVQSNNAILQQSNNFTDLKNNTTITRIMSLPIESTITEYKTNTNCIVIADLNFLNFIDGTLVYQKEIKNSKKYFEKKIEKTGDNFNDLSNLDNFNIMETTHNIYNSSKFNSFHDKKYFTNPSIIFSSYEENIITETIMKLKYDCIKFIKNI